MSWNRLVELWPIRYVVQKTGKYDERERDQE
jgi:hypothetical protein